MLIECMWIVSEKKGIRTIAGILETEWILVTFTEMAKTGSKLKIGLINVLVVLVLV